MKILLCTIGDSPQVATETVWALKANGWTPDVIHVVTTTFGLTRGVSEALRSAHGPMAELLGISPPPVWIHVPCTDESTFLIEPLRPEGDWSSASAASPPLPPAEALYDMNTQREAALMGNLILELVKAFKRSPENELHISLAGGRKTMSAHALMALSLHGRVWDQASHVLVDSAYEGNREFWHPDQPGGLIRYKDAEPSDPPSLDPTKAKIWLVPMLPPLMLNRVRHSDELEKLDLLTVILDHNFAVAGQPIMVDISTNTATAGNKTCKFGKKGDKKAFALYRLLAVACREHWPGAGPDGVGTESRGWLTYQQIANGKTPDGSPIRSLMREFLADAVNARHGDVEDDEMLQSWDERAVGQREGSMRLDYITNDLRPYVSKLPGFLISDFGLEGGRLYSPESRSESRAWPPRFGLNLPANAIVITRTEMPGQPAPRPTRAKRK